MSVGIESKIPCEVEWAWRLDDMYVTVRPEANGGAGGVGGIGWSRKRVGYLVFVFGIRFVWSRVSLGFEAPEVL